MLAQKPQSSALPTPQGGATLPTEPAAQPQPPQCGRKDGLMLRELPRQVVSKGAISQLQEFVQGAKLYPMPPNCPVLQWEYDTRMIGTSLEFRATVAFLLDGVPHHTVGVWKPSKKLAQRDAAERSLGLFVNRWGELAAMEQVTVQASPQPGRPLVGKNDVRAVLEDYCTRLMPCPAPPPQWSHRWESGLCQAFVEVRLLDVSHTFPGKPCQEQEAAHADAARRVLWYLQCPGFEESFEPDLEYVKAAAQTIPEPAASWSKDGDAEGEEQQLAERKTTIMRVQNRLQQAYARQLEAGTSVWYWSYERDPKDKGWPPLFRATVHVPLAARTFIGAWLRGQREAQINTCTQIAEFLDTEFPRNKTF